MCCGVIIIVAVRGGDPVKQENVVHLDIPELCNDKECFDEVLLNDLRQIVSTSDHDLFIVLHQKGNHGLAYYQRVPEVFEKIHASLSNL